MVIGYGAQAKRDLTGSVSTVSSNQLQNANIGTPDEALQGRISGVSVHRNSHEPGGNISVNVHGTTSLTASGTPLYVINGIPINTNYQTSSDLTGGGSNPLNSINEQNIASISVLKGPSATGIYGSRGANGVVLITTKQGKSGQSRIGFNTSVGISHISKKLNFMPAKPYAIQANHHQTLRGDKPYFTQQQVNDFADNTTNWQNLILRRGVQQKYNLTFSGGSDKLRYFISGNYSDNNGIVKGSGIKKYGTEINLNANMSSKFTLGGDITYTITDNSQVLNGNKGYISSPSVIASIINAPPTAPLRDEDGNLSNIQNYPRGGAFGNPVQVATRYKNIGNTRRFIGNIHGEFDILDNLSIKVRLGGDLRNWKLQQYYPIGTLVGGNGRAMQAVAQNTNFVDNNILTYKKDFENQSLKVMAGYTYQVEKNENLSAASQDFPSDFYQYHNLGIGGSPQPPGSGASKYTLVSYLGRINYTLFDKYLFTATVREDGNSKFGEDHKYGTFPSFAFAWRIGNENFLKNSTIISHLKLRIGWGKTGNAAINPYQSLSLISASFSPLQGYVFNGSLVPIASPNGIANPNLSWEKTSAVNVGLDAGFLNSRLTVGITYYHKKTTDLLLNVPIPHQTGFESILKNTGSLRNNGLGIHLKSINVRGNSFIWTTDVNISGNRNKVLSLSSSSNHIYTGFTGGGNISGPGGSNVTRIQVGHPVGAFYGAVFDGVWRSQKEIDQVGTMPSAKPGDIRYKDLNGDGVFNDKDYKFLGNANPKFSFGMANNFHYKNWNLRVFLYGKYGNKVLNIPEMKFVYSATGTSAKRLHRWTADNTDSNIPSAVAKRMTRVNSKVVEDGTFLRIQNISLSYSIPVNGNVIHKAKVGVTVNNAAVFDSYNGYDPEVNSFGTNNETKGVDLYDYPASRTFLFNFEIQF